MRVKQKSKITYAFVYFLPRRIKSPLKCIGKLLTSPYEIARILTMLLVLKIKLISKITFEWNDEKELKELFLNDGIYQMLLNKILRDESKIHI